MESVDLKSKSVDSGSEKGKHLSFQECLGDNWREYFRQEDVLLKVLEAAGLNKTHDFVQVRSRYLVDDSRIALILLIKRKGTEVLDKVIVDVGRDHSSFEQFMDVIFNIGSDSDYRIIVYDKNGSYKGLDGPSVVCFGVLDSLMHHLEGRMFLTVVGIDLRVDESNDINCQCVDVVSAKKIDKFPFSLPDRIEFEKMNFWGPYFLPAHVGYPLDHFPGYNDDYLDSYTYEEDCSDYVRSSADWTDEGMIIEYEFRDGDLEWLLANRQEVIFEWFEDFSIVDNVEERQLTVTSKNTPINNAVESMPIKNIFTTTEHKLRVCRSVPFRNFIYSNNKDKWSLAKEFGPYARSAQWFDELLAEREDVIQ